MYICNNKNRINKGGNMNKKKYFEILYDNRKFLSIITIFVCILYYCAYSCGGGMIPYVPTQTGAGASASTGEFFLIEKGVAVDMFNVKKLQPLFQNIRLSGNERKNRKSMKRSFKKSSKVTYAKADSSAQASSDSLSVTQNKQSSENESQPILNLHRFH